MKRAAWQAKDLAESIGIAARRARTALGMTQAEIGEVIGITSEYYARIERGHAMPSIETFCRMVAVLQVSADVLLGVSSVSMHEVVMSQHELARLRQAYQWRKLMQRLRQARPEALRLAELLLGGIEEVRGVPVDDGDDAGDNSEMDALPPSA